MSSEQNKNIFRAVKEYFLITLGILIYTCGWTIFLTPNNMFGGGVSGISAIIQFATGIKMGYSYFAINALLLIISLFIIGPSFGVKTVYAIFLASFCLNFEQTIIPAQFIQDFALSNGKLLCAIIGGSMAGFGIGMSISQGGSSGGTDIIALIITKYRNVSPGKVILLIDVFIIGSSLLVPSIGADGKELPFVDKFITAVYGMIVVTVCGNVADLYLAGSRRSVQLFIMSHDHDEIADMIVYTAEDALRELIAKTYIQFITTLFYICSVSIGQGSQIIIGHLVGAGKTEEAKKQGFASHKIAMLIAVSVSVIGILLRIPLISIFTSDQAVISIASGIFFINLFLELGRTTNLVLIACLRGAGDVLYPTVCAVFSNWALSVLGSYLLAVVAGWGIYGLWIALAADECFRGILMILRWRSTKWKTKKKISSAEPAHP